MKGLPDGSYRIGAFPFGTAWDYGMSPPDATLWYPGTQDLQDAAVIEIHDANTVDGVVFTYDR